MTFRAAAALLGALLLLASQATAQEDAASLPEQLTDVGLDQRLGERVPAELPFVDHRGEATTLGAHLGRRPVLLVPVYYECPMLCGMVLDGVTAGLRPLSFDAGGEFQVLVFSFDPGEGPEEAREARQRTLDRYGRPGSESGWHFLTGSEDSIRRLTESIGFRYGFDQERQQYVHAAGVVLLTPEGRISRYFFGVEPAPRDLRLGLVEAADRKIGSVVDQVMLYCFQYDPTTGRYSAVALNLVRLGGGLTVLAILVFIGVMLLRERRQRRRAPSLGEAGDVA